MIRKVDMYQCVCDRCGKTYIDECEGIVAWADGNYASNAAYEDGWADIDGKDYCPDCYEYDEETDDYYAKPKQQNFIGK